MFLLPQVQLRASGTLQAGDEIFVDAGVGLLNIQKSHPMGSVFSGEVHDNTDFILRGAAKLQCEGHLLSNNFYTPYNIVNTRQFNAW